MATDPSTDDIIPEYKIAGGICRKNHTNLQQVISMTSLE